MPLSTSNYEYTTTNIPAFLSKLWTLVEDPKYDELIAWDPAGFSFHVFDQTRFSREILPRFFKHNNMASFIRQLNMYGFRKVNSIDHGSLKSEKEDMEFHHPYFMRGKEQFLEFIKRKVPDLKMVNSQPVNTISSSPNPSNNSSALQIQYPQLKTEELTKVLDDVNSMKSRQKLVDDSIFNMKKENEALWKEIASLRQKHHHQQQIVNKLIHFLVHLVNPSSLGLKRTRPLMIDSHAASKFAHLDDNDHNEFPDLDDTIGNGTGTDGKTKSNMNHPSRTIIENDDEDEVVEDDDDDDDHFLISTSTNNGKSRHQIVEIEDYDDHASTAAAKTRLSTNHQAIVNRLGQQIDHGGNVVVDGGRFQEIETINRNKTMHNNGGNNNGVSKKTTRGEFTIVEQEDGTNESLVGDGVPLAKRLKPEDTNELASNQIDLNHQVENNNGKDSDAFLAYPSMFLNTPAASGPAPNNSSSLPVELVNNNNNNNNNTVPATGPATPINLSTPQASNSPIVTTPGSPSLDLAKINGDASSTSSSTSVVNGNTSSATGMPVTNSNTMNDYVESLQLDLNSIKEFLTQNSFNTIDPYTINNLFSPIVLDQMDNESVPFYLEGPTDTTPNSSNDRNNTWSHAAGEITANAGGVSGVINGVVGSNDPSTN